MILKTEDELIEFGYKLGSLLKKGSVVLLEGDLGAGKTTMTKGIGKALDVKKIINSPTFTILKIYQGKMPLYHMDLYRLTTPDYELEEFIEADGITVIEWPTMCLDLIPNEYIKITITINDDSSRCLNIEIKGSKYDYLRGAIC